MSKQIIPKNPPFSWNNELDFQLINSFEEIKDKGNFPDGARGKKLQKEFWECFRIQFIEYTDTNPTITQIKNRWGSLKKDYKEIRSLLSSGHIFIFNILFILQ